MRPVGKTEIKSYDLTSSLAEVAKRTAAFATRITSANTTAILQDERRQDERDQAK